VKKKRTDELNLANVAELNKNLFQHFEESGVQSRKSGVKTREPGIHLEVAS